MKLTYLTFAMAVAALILSLYNLKRVAKNEDRPVVMFARLSGQDKRKYSHIDISRNYDIITSNLGKE